MSATPRFSLPFIAPQQAQKQVSFNEAMTALDQLLQPSVKSRSLSTPPASPFEGDSYLVAAAATGAWTGKETRMASWCNGAWSFRTPTEGWLVYVLDTAEIALFRSGSWTTMVTNGGTTLSKFGINATADLVTRFVVGAASSLFNHDGAGHRLKLNKASAAETATVVFQDNFSGRAELGLAGDDGFRIKASADGTAWFEALSVDVGAATVDLPGGRLGFPAVANLSTDPNTLDTYEEGSWTPTVLFGSAAVGVTYATASTKGRYTRIGRLVSATGILTLTSKGTSSGTAQLGGLPYASPNDAIYGGCSVGYAFGLASVIGAVQAMVAPNSSRINLYQSNNGSSSGLTNTHFGNTTALYVSALYEV